MIKNNYNRLVDSFSMLKIRSYDLAHLPVSPVVIYDI